MRGFGERKGKKKIFISKLKKHWETWKIRKVQRITEITYLPKSPNKSMLIFMSETCSPFSEKDPLDVCQPLPWDQSLPSTSLVLPPIPPGVSHTLFLQLSEHSKPGRWPLHAIFLPQRGLCLFLSQGNRYLRSLRKRLLVASVNIWIYFLLSPFKTLLRTTPSLEFSSQFMQIMEDFIFVTVFTRATENQADRRRRGCLLMPIQEITAYPWDLPGSCPESMLLSIFETPA